ncbi:MAG: chromosome segregation protein SMC [Methylophilaceae bacterium]
MRLTHLKLAGFKSFVDPTTIHMHGQRVGVVGPNGCGKSNVMESVRWVLGESSAKEMRADAMDAVIFNGSANRKPISRASVELIFDNSFGGASGEWSQYAEIAVKRIIEREKGSTYYINNTAVRRRDVADLFLGTGLGGRAYAIIGQNTISRIVDAKPEELRVYLEEAAGISKYKERRRETELRLRDARENLTRVEDICRELQKQITKLESQAVVTQQYHALQAALKLAEGQLWLLKKRDASRDWEKAKANVEKLVNQLEAQMAELRKSESNLETCRQAFYAASEAINTAQAAYYEANAEVANLENQVKQNAEARERMAQQLQQLTHSIERNATVNSETQLKLAQLNIELETASALELQAASTLEALITTLPEKEATLKKVAELAQKSQQALTEANQRIQIETNNIQYLNRSIDENTQRLERLEADLAGLERPDYALLKNVESDLAQAQQSIVFFEKNLQKLRNEETQLQSQILTLREVQNAAQRSSNQAEAEMQSLQKIQLSLNSEGKLSDWLNSKGLKNNVRLWQKIKIDSAWSVALEAILGEKLNALIANSVLDNRPPGSLVLGFAGASKQNTKANASLKPLVSVILDCPNDLQAILADWLEGAFLLAPGDDANKAIASLNLGEKLVNQQGDVLTRHSITYHGENTNLHGVIERQQRLETLQKELPKLQANQQAAGEQLSAAEKALQNSRELQQTESNQLKTATQTLHQQQLELSRLQQAMQVSQAREATIQAEILTANTRNSALQGDISKQKATLQAIASKMNGLEMAKNADANKHQLAEEAFQFLRDTVMQAEKSKQEATFNFKLIYNNINDLNNKINVISEESKAFLLRKTETENALEITPMETLKTNLAQAIDTKLLRETALTEARNTQASVETKLQELDRTRMQNEQQLHPIRDSVEQSRLSEQGARLYFEQCQLSLQENGLDEAELAKGLAENAKTSNFLNKTNSLQQEIEALGPVNLAAIQELTTETERKSYLDSQMLDLTEASETLEEAIKKIDRETRDKLMQTFNSANAHFDDLFKTLFAGGQAKLELLGDEILDTGLQVFAQPPGKKNTTIQLLSGGEKALTALALVFALFRLNPAPFCLMDEVDAPLDDSNTERFCAMVEKMSEKTQFMFVSHNKITMEMAQQLIGVTMQESGVSRIVDVDINAAVQMQAENVA